MTDDKRTIEVPMHEIVLARLDKIDAKVDAHRAESARRGEENAAKFKSLEARVDGVLVEQKRLNERMSHAESDIRELREQGATVLRATSEVDLEHEAAIGGAMAYSKSVGDALNTIREKDLPELRANDEIQNRVDRAICSELGLDYDAIATPSAIVVANEVSKKTTLRAIARENKFGVGGTVLTIILLALQIAWKLLESHH